MLKKKLTMEDAHWSVVNHLISSPAHGMSKDDAEMSAISARIESWDEEEEEPVEEPENEAGIKFEDKGEGKGARKGKGVGKDKGRDTARRGGPYYGKGEGRGPSLQEKVAETVMQKLTEAKVLPAHGPVATPPASTGALVPIKLETSSGSGSYTNSELTARIVAAISKAEACCKAAARMSRQAQLAFDEEAHHLAEARELYSTLAGGAANC